MASIYFARIKKSSKYSYQDPGAPFAVWLTESAAQAADGYLWEADLPGRHFRANDLELYVRGRDGALVRIREKKY